MHDYRHYFGLSVYPRVVRRPVENADICTILGNALDRLYTRGPSKPVQNHGFGTGFDVRDKSTKSMVFGTRFEVIFIYLWLKTRSEMEYLPLWAVGLGLWAGAVGLWGWGCGLARGTGSNVIC